MIDCTSRPRLSGVLSTRCKIISARHVLQILVIVAASHLDAVTFQICSQSFKIMPTAVFAVWLLGQYLAPMQWASLPVLATGVVFVTLNGSTASKSGASDGDLLLLGLGASALSGLSSAYAGDTHTHPTNSGALGRALWQSTCERARLLSDQLGHEDLSTCSRSLECTVRRGCHLSVADSRLCARSWGERELTLCDQPHHLPLCFAGVYFEKYVKGKQGQTLWIRNLQLSIYGVPLSILYTFLKDGRCALPDTARAWMVSVDS